MRSNVRRLLMIAGAIGIVLSSYLLTLKLLDSWEPLSGAAQAVSPLQEPSYDVSKLPHLKPGQSIDFTSNANQGALLSGWSAVEPHKEFGQLAIVLSLVSLLMVERRIPFFWKPRSGYCRGNWTLNMYRYGREEKNSASTHSRRGRRALKSHSRRYHCKMDRR